MINVSIFMPSIRVHLLPRVYTGIAKSCKRYSWELVVAGPFPPLEIRDNGYAADKFRWCFTYAQPSVAAQEAAYYCEGKMILHSVDDSLWREDAVDLCVEQWLALSDRKAVINCRYTEGKDYDRRPMPDNHWEVRSHKLLQEPGVPLDYKIALHFLMDAGYFREMGGFDCEYEYQNFNVLDLMYRIQHDGGKLHDSTTVVTDCDNLTAAGDHIVIEEAFPKDLALYQQRYSDPQYLAKHTRIPFDNWKDQPEVWVRRFPKKFGSYEEMLAWPKQPSPCS